MSDRSPILETPHKQVLKYVICDFSAIQVIEYLYDLMLIQRLTPSNLFLLVWKRTTGIQRSAHQAENRNLAVTVLEKIILSYFLQHPLCGQIYILSSLSS